MLEHDIINNLNCLIKYSMKETFISSKTSFQSYGA